MRADIYNTLITTCCRGRMMFVLERLIGAIAPHNCLECGVEGSLLCTGCLPDAVVALPSRCYRCRAITKDFAVCKKCRPKSRIKNVWVCAEYESLPKKLVHLYKFERAQAAAEIIGHQMATVLPILSEQTILLPVPSATTRQRIRGYDHTGLLCKSIYKYTRLHHFSVLGRLGQSRQVGSTRQKRLKQLEGAFYIKNTSIVGGANILLVDDIITTGATLEACAKLLKQAGAKSVSAIVFAQKTTK